MPIDTIISDISTLGWLFSNCYQDDYGVWRVNLRRPTGNGSWFSDWAEGTTLTEALEECMSKLHEATFVEDTDQSIRGEPAMNLSALIAGLRKPVQIKRRF